MTDEPEDRGLAKTKAVGYRAQTGAGGDAAEKNLDAQGKHRGVLFVCSKQPKKKTFAYEDPVVKGEVVYKKTLKN